jgi:hypothetical protein
MNEIESYTYFDYVEKFFLNQIVNVLFVYSHCLIREEVPHEIMVVHVILLFVMELLDQLENIEEIPTRISVIIYVDDHE